MTIYLDNLPNKASLVGTEQILINDSGTPVDATASVLASYVTSTIAVPTGGTLYVNTNAVTNGNGSQLNPFNSLQSAINAAVDFDTIFVTTSGDHAENITMRDLNGIAIIGNSESNTAIANVGNSHTFTWIPTNTTGASVRKFTLRNIEFINSDTTGTYHGIHIDASAVVYPNTFCVDEFDLDVVDIEASCGQGKTGAYFRNTGQVFWTHGQMINGDLTLINTAVFRTRQVEIGGLGAPANLNLTYDGTLEHNGLGRSDVSIGQQSIVWGNVLPTGHPIFQMDQSSLIVGGLTATNTLTSFYASGRDYCPVFSLYGQFGILGGNNGNINITFPDPQTSGTSFSVVDMSRAHVLGTVTFTKTNLLPLNARGYAVVFAQAQFDTTAANGITVNGYVSLDLRGGDYNKASITSTGSPVISLNTPVINDWVQSNAYAAGATVMYRDSYTYIANAAIPAGTAWSVGVSGQTWRLVSRLTTEMTTSQISREIIAANPVTPSLMEGLRLWLESDSGVYSDAGVTPAIDAATVQQWNDKSGNGNNLVQATAGSRPTFNTAQINGLPALTFGGSHVMTLASTAGVQGRIRTIVAVIKSTAAPGSQKTFLGADNAGVATGAIYFKASNMVSSGRAAIEVGSGATGSTIVNASTDQNLWVVYSATINETTGEICFYKGRTLVNRMLANGAIRAPSGNGWALGAGYYNHAIADYFVGQIYSVCMFDSILAPTEIASVAAYFEQKLARVARGKYGFICMRNQQDGQLCMEIGDGLKFRNQPINFDGKSVTYAGVRDPSIWYDAATGVFWMAFTNAIAALDSNTWFGIAKSTDLVNWTFVRQVDCSSVTGTSTSGANKAYTWAPQWCVKSDGKPYIIIALSNNNLTTIQQYYLEPTDTTMATWSLPVAITINTVAQSIDMHVVYFASNNSYYAVYRNVVANYVEIAKGSSPYGPFTPVKSGNWGSQGQNLEGPVLLQMDDRLRLYSDSQGAGYYYMDNMTNTVPDAGTWLAKTAIADFTGGMMSNIQHGEVFLLPPNFIV